MKAYAANSIWTASCFPEWLRFQQAANHVEETQHALLINYLRTNAFTEFGRRHKFSSIDSVKKYQERIPITSYDDYVDSILKIGNGELSVLTSEPVRLFELSSGSTAASKLIPYTGRLKAEFQRGIAPWIYNLYTQYPKLKYGPAYWSITPLTNGKKYTPAGIPIGFESDSAYLGPLGKWLLDSVMAVPDSVKNISDVDSFRYLTLLYLLKQPELRLISIWNPTFLSLLLEQLPKWWDRLIADIANGTVSLENMNLRFRPDPQYARQLETFSPDEHASIWPHLTLISCWMDGPSTLYADQLRKKFAHVTFQPKGLLATEAFVSFPITGVEGGVLSMNSHFFEFMDENRETVLAHQTHKGKCYSVVVTTGGGLYRYQLNDVIEVIGHWRQIPCIRFVGKANHISDWFGEKLEERFVANILQEIFSAHQLSPIFAMLAPDDLDGFRYVLYLENQNQFDSISEELDLALRQNFHYDYCRKLGQLHSVQVRYVSRGVEKYIQACQARGQKLGNIKPGVLQKTTGWDVVFREN